MHMQHQYSAVTDRICYSPAVIGNHMPCVTVQDPHVTAFMPVFAVPAARSRHVLQPTFARWAGSLVSEHTRCRSLTFHRLSTIKGHVAAVASAAN